MLSRQKRMRVLKSGRILLDDGTDAIACTIRNVSLGGAGLELPGWVELPPVFVIDATGWPPRVCRIAWREGDRMGVQFLDQPEEREAARMSGPGQPAPDASIAVACDPSASRFSP
jgi:hypothetical protein